MKLEKRVKKIFKKQGFDATIDKFKDGSYIVSIDDLAYINISMNGEPDGYSVELTADPNLVIQIGVIIGKNFPEFIHYEPYVMTLDSEGTCTGTLYGEEAYDYLHDDYEESIEEAPNVKSLH